MAGAVAAGGRADLRPLAVTVLAAGAATGLLLVAIPSGWLGADVGRGAEFCERWRDDCLKQPVNTVSNLGFLVAGLAIAWVARHREARGAGPLARTAVVTALASVVALLGPASAAMHATGTDLGGSLDLLSMHLVAGFAAAYALVRRSGHPRPFGPWFLGFVLLAQTAALVPGEVPVVRHPENLTFAALVLLAVACEGRRGARPSRTGAGWLAGAVCTLLVAFAVWNLAQGPWCDPDSWVQGHGAWHLLCALSCWLLFRFYASERLAAGPDDLEQVPPTATVR